MSLERKIARGKIRAAWKNKNVPFATLWARHQIKKYGFKKARALNFIGKGLATLTNQIKMAAYGVAKAK